MKSGESKVRKVRSDKKRDIKPTVSIDLKDSIFRLSFITKTPVKDICEKFLIHAVNDRNLIEGLSKNFQRGIFWGKDYFNGTLDNERIPKREDIESDRISIRVKNDLYNQISSLGYALDLSVSRTSSLLLFESIIDAKFIESYLEAFVETLDDARKKELKAFLNYVNGKANQEFSLAAVVSFLIEEPIKWLFPSD